MVKAPVAAKMLRKTTTARVTAAAPKGPGRETKYKGVKLEFLDTYGKEEYTSCHADDHGNFYAKVARAFLKKFGYTRPYEAVVSADVDIDSLKAPSLDVETMDNELYSAELSRREEMRKELKKVSDTASLRNTCTYLNFHYRTSDNGTVTVFPLRQPRGPSSTWSTSSLTHHVSVHLGNERLISSIKRGSGRRNSKLHSRPTGLRRGERQLTKPAHGTALSKISLTLSRRKSVKNLRPQWRKTMLTPWQSGEQHWRQ